MSSIAILLEFVNIRPTTMGKEPRAQAEKIYQEILDLLEELASAYVDARDNTEESEEEDVDEGDLVDLMVEEGAERGLDEEQVERVFKAVTTFARKAGED